MAAMRYINAQIDGVKQQVIYKRRKARQAKLAGASASSYSFNPSHNDDPEDTAPLVPRARPDVPSSRFSGSTTYSSWLLPDPPTHPAPHVPPTPAQEYARSVSALGHAEQVPQQQQQRGAYWLQPSHTGGSGGSRNPFLR